MSEVAPIFGILSTSLAPSKSLSLEIGSLVLEIHTFFLILILSPPIVLDTKDVEVFSTLVATGSEDGLLKEEKDHQTQLE